MNEIESAYRNAYLLLIGEITYDELAEQGEFFLPEEHEDPDVVLKYYESIEDYEKCKKIIERNS
jgi:hypothetical protein